MILSAVSELIGPILVWGQGCPAMATCWSSIPELTSKDLTALEQASEWVRTRFSFACTRTDEAQLHLQQSADHVDGDAVVRIAAA